METSYTERVRELASGRGGAIPLFKVFMPSSAKLKLLLAMTRKLVVPFQLRKIANYLHYRSAMPAVRRYGPDALRFCPANVLVAVTSQCNKKCSFCYFNGELNHKDSARNHLTHQGFVDILHHPLVRNALRISFTGGEPLLNADVFAMIRDAKRCGHIVSLNTNGTLLRQRVRELLAEPPHVLTISFYPEDEGHLAAAVPLIAQQIPIKLNFVLSVQRLRHLSALCELALRNRVVMIDIENVHHSLNTSTDVHGDSGGASISTAHDSPVSADMPEYKQCQDAIRRKYGRSLSISWPVLREKYAVQSSLPSGTVKCRVFWHSLHLNALGQISPCCQWPLASYDDSIFDNPQAWNSLRMRSLRRAMREAVIPKNCKGCHNLRSDYLGI